MLRQGHEFAPGYRLETFLGRGQFGQVWRVTAPGGTSVAVKFIDLTGGEGRKEHAGIKRVKQIRHAHLMPITAIWMLDREGRAIAEPATPSPAAAESPRGDRSLETSQTAGDETELLESPATEPQWLAVAMLLGGENLLECMQSHQAAGHPGIPPRELVDYIEEAAKGIDFLNAPQHDLGSGLVAIQHCDIKPANIVLIGGSAVVCDFGLARILSRGQATATAAVGTPAYMAPEAIEGRPSRTTDEYALAITYYQLRTGVLPLQSGSVWEILDTHRRGRLDFSRVPQAEQDVLRRATAYDWNERFPSALAMAQALREAILAPGASHALLASTPTETLLPDTYRQGGSVTHARDVQSGGAETADAVVLSRRWRISGRWASAAAAGAIALLGLAGWGLRSWFGTTSSPADTSVALVEQTAEATKETLESAGAKASAAGESPPGPPDAPAPLDSERMAQAAFAEVERDFDRAVEQFTRAATSDGHWREIAPYALTGQHRGAIRSTLLTRGGRYAVTSADDSHAVLWDLDSDHPAQGAIRLEEHQQPIETVTLAPDGQRLLTAGWDGQVVLWDLLETPPRVVQTLSGHEGDVIAVAAHPSKPYAVTASLDQKLGIWELASGDTSAASRLIADVGSVKQMAFDPSGQWLLVLRDDASRQLMGYAWEELIASLKINLAPQPVPITTEGTEAYAFCFVDLGQQGIVVATGGREVSLWDLVEPPRLRHRWTDHLHQEAIEALASAQARPERIATASADATARVWNAEQTALAPRLLSGHSSVIEAIALSADGRWVATAGWDGQVILWDLSTSNPIRHVRLPTPAGAAHTVALDPRGRWLVAGSDKGTAYRWDLRHAKLLTRLPQAAEPAKPEAASSDRVAQR